MRDKLKEVELESQLGDPRVYGDAEKLRQVNREQKELTPVVACYRAYLRAQDTAPGGGGAAP